jgi:hypothetical protein
MTEFQTDGTSAVEEPPIIKAEDADTIDPNLPPAGYERDEELKKRIDYLEAMIERLVADRDIHTIDPAAMKVDREIRYELDKLTKHNELAVSDAQPGRVYKWIYYGLNGRMITKMKYFGYEVVSGDDLECRHLREVDGTRRLGDTLLMWIPEERFAILERANDERRIKQQQGIEARLRELGEKYRDKGLIVRTNLEDMHLGKGEKTVMDVVKQKAASRAGMRKVDRMLREGSVPGMPSPKGGA